MTPGGVDMYGRVSYTPGNMTPKRADHVYASPWAPPPPNPLKEIKIECIDCGPFIGRAGSLLFFCLMFGVRHR